MKPLSEIVNDGTRRLAEAQLQCADPRLHMRQIACVGLKCGMARIFSRWDDPVPPEEAGRIEAFLKRRLTGEPFQYILGSESFWKSDFEVGRGVLIPRKETEGLVEQLLKKETGERPRIVELGAGSGNIGISVLRERPKWIWWAFEASHPALAYARKNAQKLLPPDASYQVVAQDFFVGAPQHGPFDWLVANPPYVPQADMETLSREVRHEPKEALAAGPDGLDVIRRLVSLLPKFLKDGGRVLLEIDSSQGESGPRLLEEAGLKDVELFRDYSGQPRVLYGVFSWTHSS